jgi:hypothetical protein
MANALDPVRFARRLGLEPDPWQAEVLRSPAKRILLNASRQSGKSTCTAIIALHEAVHQAGSLVLLFSASQRQASELFRVVSRLYGAIGHEVPAEAQTLLRLELGNGSRVLSLPASETTVRGYAAASLAIFDEASRVQDDLFLSVLPMLATTNGRVIALSTPFGKRGWWSDCWHQGGDTWQRWEVPAPQCPRISPEFLEDQQRAMGEWWYRQEFLCEFLDSETSAFSTEDVESAFGEVETWEL